jgi:hypothetical protein
MLTAPFEEESGTEENSAILNDNILLLITKNEGVDFSPNALMAATFQSPHLLTSY